MAVTIRMVVQADAQQVRGLCELLQDSVAGDASVGFLADLPTSEAETYWTQVLGELGAALCLWIAEDNGRIVGSVQLAPCAKANGRHRADVQKLLVLRSHRGQGIASRLMETAEAEAIARGRHLLVLDTLQGSAAESIYSHLGWTRGGAIPQYAAHPNGELAATVYFYKLLAR
ncbi:MAG: GNAT family N-acetyltransferase [Pseudomonadota bacterium]|nr:GNAT family N-acetyltransferase [Pseudomonadota bacterium]